MNWRFYLLNPLTFMAAAGLLLAFTIQPIRRALQRGRTRRAVEAARMALPPDGNVTRPDEPYAKHRAWRVPRPKYRGYYSSGE